MKNKSILTALVLLAIVCGGFVVHLYLFSQTKYVNGTDGGFYAYKAREIVKDGVYNLSIFSTPSTPPVFFLTSAFFAKFFGAFDGVKIATALYSVLVGVSVFILTKYVTKSDKAGLIAAFFVIFSPMSLRIAADIRKNMAGLFFIPLIIYFMLKFFEALSDLPRRSSASPRKHLRGVGNSHLGGGGIGEVFPWRGFPWKHAISLVIVGALGVLSHTSVITVWFVAWGYFAFYLGVKGKPSLKEFLPILAANLAIVIAFFLFYDKVSSNLGAIAATSGPVEMPEFERLNEYILPLAMIAVPGIFLAFGKRSRRDIFLLAWLILSFLLTFSQVAGAKEYWRFALLMFVPVTIFVGYSFNWLFGKLRYIGLIVLFAVGVIGVRQFFDFGYHDFQMRPQLNEEVLESLEREADRIGRNNYVYTDAPGHSYFWVRYFFGFKTRRYAEDSLEEINELINQGEAVYLVRGELGETPEEPRDREPLPMKPNERMEPRDFKDDGFAPEDKEVKVLKLSSPIEAAGIEELIGPPPEPYRKPEREEYDFGRLNYLSTYLILPYEVINAIDPSYLPLWQIQLGLPLSLLIIGLVASLLLELKVGDFVKYFAIAVGILIVFIIYGLNPSIFWGARRHREMEPPPMKHRLSPPEAEFKRPLDLGQFQGINPGEGVAGEAPDDLDPLDIKGDAIG